MSDARAPARPADGPYEVRCLPVAGTENPYQHLMMEGLAAHPALRVGHGAEGKLWAVLRTALRDRPALVHFDWPDRYLFRNPDLLSPMSSALFRAQLWIARRLFGVRFAWTLHNLASHEGGLPRHARRARRALARHAEWVRVFSDDTVPRAAASLGVDTSRFRVVPEGSYAGYYADGLSRPESRERLGVREEETLLVSLGGLRPYKGIEDLLDAFERVRRPGWRLVIAGRPLVADYAEAVQRRAAAIPGAEVHARFVPDDELQVYFGAADAAVYPFKKVENSGSVILAMGFGVPVVAPAMGVLPTRLRQQADLLYPEGEIDEGLERFAAAAPERLRQIGEANREAARATGWEAFGELVAETLAGG